MLLELIVALALSGLVMSMVFYSWRYVSNHTLKQQRRTLFQTEADRIVRTLGRELRLSPGVTRIDRNRLSLLRPDGVDTVNYKFEYGAFTKNDTAFWQDDGRARICQFDVEKESVPLDADTLPAITLLITIGFTDRFGDSAAYPLKARVERPAGEARDRFGRGGTGWNF
jgi:hypothetical protein